MSTDAQTEMVYLADDVKIEPLVHRWYAWSHLISPAQLALNLAYRQIPMLRSFVTNPRVHEAASSDPRMLGGSFLELKADDVIAARQLLQDTLKSGAPLLRLAEDLIKQDRQLHKGETGHSLDHVYANLPESLAGMVEVTYDLNGNPSLRIFEEMLYKDRPTDARAEEIAFSRIDDSKRNFFLNTPRLPTDERMIVPLPFSSEHFSVLSRARIERVPFSEITSALGVSDEESAKRLRSYFSTEPPARHGTAYEGEGMRVRYFGHACVMVQSAESTILIDPFLAWDRNDEDGRLTFHDLPDHIDYIFLTHNHQDHFSIELLLQLRGRIGQILIPRNNPHSLADPSMKLVLEHIGHRNVRVMDPLETIELSSGRLMSIPFYGEHADLSIDSKQGLFVELKGKTFMFLADSDNKDRALYKRLVKLVGTVDILFIGMECDGAPLTWLYGPYLSAPINRKDDESRRLSGSDSDRAWSIVEELQCKTAYVYAMGQEPWLRFVAGLEYTKDSKQIIESDRFVTRCRAEGIHSERLHGSRTFEY
ncbi:MBL fold metallo-hydrolase [Luteibacter sp. ME-Dv--P-043b]|uniref:MBL fold metallo-hydrolase n=1 Tax=Luteibacter sp. ME-Dv--P-043b TaxID=3040291 RepID=UPI0025545C01|nr:MBL fold metallo-hydrolase [Luteibacter sp. ME-Dv--P-043b]